MAKKKEVEKVTVPRARVTLSGCASYKLGGRKFMKDLPKIVKGEEAITEFRACAYFTVTDLAPKEMTTKKADKLLDGSGKKKKAKKSKEKKDKKSSSSKDKKAKDKKKKKKKK